MKMSEMSLLASAMNPLGLASIPIFKERASYTKRVPNCQKCGQHGRKSRLKGHKRVCPFKDCECTKCQVVTDRQKLMADQIKIRRRQRKDSLMSFTKEKISATLNAAAAAGPLPYLNNLNMIYNQLNQSASAVPNASVTSEIQTIAASTTSPIQQASRPINASPTVLSSNVDPDSSSTQIPVTSCFLPGNDLLNSTTTTDSMTSPRLQLPLLLGNDSNAALAAFVSSAASTMPNIPVTSVAESMKESDISLPQKISPISTQSETTTLNPLSNYSNQFVNLLTSEQILAILANLQLSNYFLNGIFETNVSKSNFVMKLNNTCAKQLAESNNNTFIDVCSV